MNYYYADDRKIADLINLPFDLFNGCDDTVTRAQCEVDYRRKTETETERRH